MKTIWLTADVAQIVIGGPLTKKSLDVLMFFTPYKYLDPDSKVKGEREDYDYLIQGIGEQILLQMPELKVILDRKERILADANEAAKKDIKTQKDEFDKLSDSSKRELAMSALAFWLKEQLKKECQELGLPNTVVLTNEF